MPLAQTQGRGQLNGARPSSPPALAPGPGPRSFQGGHPVAGSPKGLTLTGNPLLRDGKVSAFRPP